MDPARAARLRRAHAELDALRTLDVANVRRFDRLQRNVAASRVARWYRRLYETARQRELAALRLGKPPTSTPSPAAPTRRTVRAPAPEPTLAELDGWLARMTSRRPEDLGIVPSLTALAATAVALESGAGDAGAVAQGDGGAAAQGDDEAARLARVAAAAAGALPTAADRDDGSSELALTRAATLIAARRRTLALLRQRGVATASRRRRGDQTAWQSLVAEADAAIGDAITLSDDASEIEAGMQAAIASLTAPVSLDDAWRRYSEATAASAAAPTPPTSLRVADRLETLFPFVMPWARATLPQSADATSPAASSTVVGAAAALDMRASAHQLSRPPTYSPAVVAVPPPLAAAASENHQQTVAALAPGHAWWRVVEGAAPCRVVDVRAQHPETWPWEDDAELGEDGGDDSGGAAAAGTAAPQRRRWHRHPGAVPFLTATQLPGATITSAADAATSERARERSIPEPLQALLSPPPSGAFGTALGDGLPDADTLHGLAVRLPPPLASKPSQRAEVGADSSGAVTLDPEGTHAWLAYVCSRPPRYGAALPVSQAGPADADGAAGPAPAVPIPLDAVLARMSIVDPWATAGALVDPTAVTQQAREATAEANTALLERAEPAGASAVAAAPSPPPSASEDEEGALVGLAWPAHSVAYVPPAFDLYLPLTTLPQPYTADGAGLAPPAGSVSGAAQLAPAIGGVGVAALSPAAAAARLLQPTIPTPAFAPAAASMAERVAALTRHVRRAVPELSAHMTGIGDVRQLAMQVAARKLQRCWRGRRLVAAARNELAQLRSAHQAATMERLAAVQGAMVDFVRVLESVAGMPLMPGGGAGAGASRAQGVGAASSSWAGGGATGMTSATSAASTLGGGASAGGSGAFSVDLTSTLASFDRAVMARAREVLARGPALGAPAAASRIGVGDARR